MSYESKIKDLETLITKVIQEIITDKELINSGTLLNSISTTASIRQDGSLSVVVSGEDYYTFLDDKYKITDSAFEGPKGDAIYDLIGDVYVEFLLEQLD